MLLEVKNIRKELNFLRAKTCKMTPKKSKEPQGNLSLLRLENITNMDHELVRLAGKINGDVL